MSFSPTWLNQMAAGMASIEAMWGEQADLLPWQKNEAARFVEPGPDTTRPAQYDCRILFKRKQATSSGDNMMKVVAEDTYAVVAVSYIEACGLTQGDRIRLRDRGGALFQVSYLGQKYTTRQRVYLTELQEPTP
jgi:hypothetical protein